MCQATFKPEEFGIVSKNDVAESDSWIFASQVMVPPQINFEQILEVNTPEDLADMCTVADLANILQSSINLYHLARNLQSQSNFTPMLLNQSMIPFMSSVSCLFDTALVGEVDDHQERLSTLVQSWGFTMHAILGDGNCCFSALASSLLYQRHLIEAKYPSLLTLLGLNFTTVEELAVHLRRKAVQEWTTNASEYQGFLPSEYDVETEAAKFKETSYFFGPLGNTMIKAVSNILSIPIIVFSSALHYPVVYTTPRICHSPIPLYLAFNQSGAGHYSALSFQQNKERSTNGQEVKTKNSRRCTCGQKDKSSTSRRCVPLQSKYTSVVRCSCLASNKSCNSSCLCHNCSNPNGPRPPKPRHPTQKRMRQNHAWQNSTEKSSLYAHHLDEQVSKGPHTKLEYLLLAQIIQFLNKYSSQTEVDLCLISKVYHLCLTLVATASLPLGSKTDEEIQAMVQIYLKNFAVFKSLCEAHVIINTQN